MAKLLLGDSLEKLKCIPSSTVDLIVTDPPYEVAVTNGGGSINKVKRLKDSLTPLSEQGLDKGYDVVAYGEGFLRVLKEPNIYTWCSKAQLLKHLDFYVNQHKCKFEILVWNKTNPLPTYSNKYVCDKEYCLYFFKGKGKTFPQSYDDAKTIYTAPINQTDKKKYLHPTIKPLEFTEHMIRNSSREGDLVLDPFMGSGTTGVACKLNNRKFIGIEIVQEYYDIAKQRLIECS